jgi:hypothetical protein
MLNHKTEVCARREDFENACQNLTSKWNIVRISGLFVGIVRASDYLYHAWGPSGRSNGSATNGNEFLGNSYPQSAGGCLPDNTAGLRN